MASKKSRVAILRTKPETVREDYHRLMNLANYQDYIDKTADTGLKVNISWHFFYPGSSTVPWQLDGVIRAMEKDGYKKDLIHACHNRTVVIDAHLGERENKQIDVVDAYGIRNVHLYEGEDWIDIGDAVGDLRKKFLCLNEVFPKGFSIPKRFIGENIIHLPTIKTHIFTTTTGAMKNAFGGLLERAPSLDPPGHPRDARRPPHDPEEDPQGCLRGHGRNVRRRRSRPALHDPAREERDPRVRRSGRDRLGRREADGHGPHGRLQVRAPRARAGPRRRRPARHRARRRRRCRQRELALRRSVQGDDVRLEEPAPHLLGPAEEAASSGRSRRGSRRGRTSRASRTTTCSGTRASRRRRWRPSSRATGAGSSRTGARSRSNDRGFPDVGEANPELIQIGAKHFAEGMRLIGMAVAESPEMNARKRRKQAADTKSTYY